MKIGVCGGTFDPFHRGHLDPILAVRERLQWNRVIWIPAYVQPFKADVETASPFHRFAMAILATERYDDFYVSTQELERGEISYTVDTLRQLRNAYPDATLDWIIGDDNLEKLHEWKSVEEIFQMANFVVLTRIGPMGPIGPIRPARPEQRGAHGSIVFAENPTVPVSSTEIRRRIRAGESIDDLVDPRVSRYIQHNGLYRKGQS
jgi:nicotinate-nucleotide adenylyltransferase